MWWTHGNWGWGGWLAMSLGMIAFWGVVIWLVVSVVRPDSGAARRQRRTPEEVLADRFAHGEIDEDEFRQRLTILAANARVQQR